jgi:hypothetical protein
MGMPVMAVSAAEMTQVIRRWEEHAPRYMLGNLQESPSEALDVLERWLLRQLQAVRDARDCGPTPG